MRKSTRFARRFVSTGVLAERLGLHRDRIVQMIEEGTVDPAAVLRPTPNGHYRIRVEEVERLVEEAERRAAG